MQSETGQWMTLAYHCTLNFWILFYPRSLATAEAEGMSDGGLMAHIIEVLSDELRPGTPAQFSLEQIVQIIAVACETTPQDCDRTRSSLESV